MRLFPPPLHTLEDGVFRVKQTVLTKNNWYNFQTWPSASGTYIHLDLNLSWDKETKQGKIQTVDQRTLVLIRIYVRLKASYFLHK